MMKYSAAVYSEFIQVVRIRHINLHTHIHTHKAHSNSAAFKRKKIKR